MWINAWLSGAISVAALAIALLFFRFWRQSRDRLFVYFSLAFVPEGIRRVMQP